MGIIWSTDLLDLPDLYDRPTDIARMTSPPRARSRVVDDIASKIAILCFVFVFDIVTIPFFAMSFILCVRRPAFVRVVGDVIARPSIVTSSLGPANAMTTTTMTTTTTTMTMTSRRGIPHRARASVKAHAKTNDGRTTSSHASSSMDKRRSTVAKGESDFDDVDDANDGEIRKDGRENEIAKIIAAIDAEGGAMTGRVEVVNRGGLVLRAQRGRFRAFLPKSQMRSSRLKADVLQGQQEMDEMKVLEMQIGKLIDVKLMDVTPKRIVVSERALLQDRAREKLPVGTRVNVVVTSLSDFGAFVEVIDGQGEASGLEGLVHISEISWNRISHPRDAVRVGQREAVKVLEVNSDTGRINFSIKQTQADPLMETLETIMPVTMPEPSIDEDDLSELPGLTDICSSLLREEGIEAVIPGRQAMEQRVVSQDLELWLTNVFVEDGYNLLARAGRAVQEIHVVTSLDRDAIKRAIKRATTVSKN